MKPSSSDRSKKLVKSMDGVTQGSHKNWAIKFSDFSKTFPRPIYVSHDNEMLKTQPFGAKFCPMTSIMFLIFKQRDIFGPKNEIP